jgi:hypothetical protein
LPPGWQFTHRVSASTGAIVAGVLVVTLGTGATAVTVALTGNDRAHTVSADSPLGAAGTSPNTPGPVQASTTASPSALPHIKAKRLITSTLLVTSHVPFSRHEVRKLGRLSRVRRTQIVMAGHAHVDSDRAFMLGVNPTSFRRWTPKATANSNALWSSIMRGDLTASFDMGHDANLPLGADVPVAATREVMPLRIGAFASVGMAGVDAVVSQARGKQLGLVPKTGVLISAPKADPLDLRKAALAIVKKHVGRGRVDLLREVIITRDAGEFLTRVQIANFLNAAKSRIGLPYVWGAAGPSSFDCSGLVQWSFAQAGIRMPRVSEEQWLTGPHVPYADARPGDLLFWHYDPTDPANIDHVGIYWGNGMMIVAPHTGLNVEYVPVPLSNLAGVVRVDPGLAAELA